MGAVQDEASFLQLCRKAFASTDGRDDSSMDALKGVANTLLLKEQFRRTFAADDYPAKVAQRLYAQTDHGQEELICTRILFLLTYEAEFDFGDLFDHHQLAESVCQNIAAHAQRYAAPDHKDEPAEVRILSENLKLFFNLNQFYPARKTAFQAITPQIVQILQNSYLERNPFSPPINHVVNALLNVEPVEGLLAKTERDELFLTVTQRLILILDRAVTYFKEDDLELNAVPLITLLRRVNESATQECGSLMKSKLLPADEEREQPLGKSDSLAARLLRLSTSPSAMQLHEGISNLQFELSDSDAQTFIHNVGYGYASGFLVSHNIPVPESVLKRNGEKRPSIPDQTTFNPITGQRTDREPPDPTLDMTDEEKEREAERLFVLFERLKATGVMNVTNPVEQAAKEGKLG